MPPSTQHDAIVELFRQRPAFAVELLTDIAHMPIPGYSKVMDGSTDLTETTPAELRADALITLTDGSGVPALGIIVEVQLRRDRRKHRSWPRYVTALHNRLKTPVALLVICPDETVARWAARPIDLGYGSRIQPLVIGPHAIPAVSDPAAARGDPELAMFSAMAHYREAGVLEALVSALAGPNDPDRDRSALYAELIWKYLPADARLRLEELMTTTGWQAHSPFARKHFGEGKAEGKTEGLLLVLEARNIDVPAAARATIEACTDLDRLDTWLQRALSAETVDDVLR